LDPRLLEVARAAIGFMPDDEGLALYRAGLAAASVGPLLEIGTYCGKSAVYLGAAAAERGTVVYTLDHHRGSEENQAGWEHHDERLVDRDTGRMDTLPFFRRTIAEAGLEETVVAIVGPSDVVGAHWSTPLGLVFIDGGHGAEPAHRDYERWSSKVAAGGLLAIHDVFPDPAEGGRPPYEIYMRALDSGLFDDVEDARCGSLWVLRRRAGE
jgi:predicted O-methyltransferase YrrM